MKLVFKLGLVLVVEEVEVVVVGIDSVDVCSNVMVWYNFCKVVV